MELPGIIELKNYRTAIAQVAYAPGFPILGTDLSSHTRFVRRIGNPFSNKWDHAIQNGAQEGMGTSQLNTIIAKSGTRCKKSTIGIGPTPTCLGRFCTVFLQEHFSILSCTNPNVKFIDLFLQEHSCLLAPTTVDSGT